MQEFINKIHYGNCMDFMRQLPDKSVDCILTDVPYKQEFHGRGMAKDRPNYIKMAEYGSNKNLDYGDFFELCIKKMKQINFFTFCDKETKFEFIKMAKEKGYGYEEIPYCKTSPCPFANNQWLPDKEWGLHIFKNIPVRGNYETKRGFSVVTNLREPNIDHPTPKKVSEIVRILKNITDENDIVLDPFSGSGTTAIACHRTGRRFICVELDKEYYEDSVKRLDILQRQQSLFGGGAI